MHSTMMMRRLLCRSALALCAGSAWAQAAAPGQSGATEVSAVTVQSDRVRSLEQFTPTGSRLGLRAKETPGSLDLITAETMARRGYNTVEEAADSLPGVISGGSPGDPASFSMRGFTGDQISVLHNGLYIGPSNMTNRPQNSFNLRSVEVLKGPASVIYGQGAIGGAVNVTNKAPAFSAPRYEAVLAAGSFGSTSIGFGAGGALSSTVAGRFDISRTGTDGYVDRSPANALNATLSLLWRPTDTLDVQLSVDWAEDEPSPYFGTPLVPAAFAARPLVGVLSTSNGYVIDERMRYRSYNVADYRIHSQQVWPQLYVKWRPAEGVTVQNLAYYFDASRRWMNAETYVFNTATRRIDRDRFFVFHEQKLSGDQASVTIERPLFGLPNKLVAGVDYSHLDFVRSRGFPDGDSVDPFNPAPGSFGPIVPRVSPTKWDSTAVFFEDQISLTPNVKLVTGGRAERMDLDRKNYGPTGAFQPGTSFTRTFEPVTWRLGAVWDATPYVTPYVSWTTGQDPVGANIFTVNAGQNFELSSSQQFEAGLKASLPDQRGSLTLAVYDIKRRNILTQIALDVVSNVGSQTSRGVEASGDLRVTPQWSVSANAAYVDAKYGRFVDPDFGVNATGNEPANVPRFVANVWTSVTDVARLPLEVGGGARYVGRRYGDTANTIRLDDYVLVDLYATYAVTPKVSVTGRVGNVLDKAYARWADVFYPSEVMLGAPRSYELSLNLRF